MRAMDLNPQDFEGDFDLEAVPAEVQDLAAKLYHGSHPALRAIGISYSSREHVIQRETIRRVVALVNRLGDADAANDALDVIFA